MAQELTEQYLISDAARQVEVETHVLRYWEEELKLPIQRNKLGHRYYTKEDVERFRIIKRWKEQGLQLKAIRNALKDPKGSIWSMMQTELGQEQDKQEEDRQEEKETDNKTVLQNDGKGDENKVDNNKVDDKENIIDVQTASEESTGETKKEQYIRHSAARGKGRRAKKSRQKASVVKWDSKRAEAALEKLDLNTQPDTEQEDIIHMADVTAEEEDPAKKAVDETQKTETKAQNAKAQATETKVQNAKAQATETKVQDAKVQGTAAKAQDVKVQEAEQAEVRIQETERTENPEKQQTEADESTEQATALSGDTVRTAEILAEEEKDRKAARFQFLLSQMMKEAVRSNNEDLIASVQELVAKEMDFQFRQQEEREQEREEQRLKREEEHFKKIDALLRTRSEQASERKKKRPLFGWN